MHVPFEFPILCYHFPVGYENLFIFSSLFLWTMAPWGLQIKLQDGNWMFELWKCLDVGKVEPMRRWCSCYFFPTLASSFYGFSTLFWRGYMKKMEPVLQKSHPFCFVACKTWILFVSLVSLVINEGESILCQQNPSWPCHPTWYQ